MSVTPIAEGGELSHNVVDLRAAREAAKLKTRQAPSRVRPSRPNGRGAWESEVANYWNAARGAARGREEGDASLVVQALAELEAIAMHSDHQRLRVQCQQVLAVS